MGVARSVLNDSVMGRQDVPDGLQIGQGFDRFLLPAGVHVEEIDEGLEPAAPIGQAVAGRQVASVDQIAA